MTEKPTDRTRTKRRRAAKRARKRWTKPTLEDVSDRLMAQPNTQPT